MADSSKSVLDVLGDVALDAGKGFLNTITGGIGGSVLNFLTGNSKNDDYNRQIKLMQEQQKQAFELMDRQANWNEHFTNLAYQQQEDMFNLEKNENRYLRETAMESQARSMDRAGLNRNLLSGTVGAGSSSAPSVPSAPSSSVSSALGQSGALSSNRDYSITEALQMSKLQAEIDNIKADTKDKESGANLNAERLKQEEIVTRYAERFQIAGLANVNQDWANKVTENGLLMRQVEEVDSQIKINEELVKKIQAETSVLDEEAKIKHAEAVVADDYWQEQLNLIGAQVGWTEQQTKDLIVTLPYRLVGLSMEAALAASNIELNSERAREIGLICDGLGISNYVAKQSVSADIKKRKNESAKAYHEARGAKTAADRSAGEWEADKGHLTFRAWTKDFQQAMDVVETGTRAGRNVADAYQSVKGSLPQQMNAKTNRNNSQIKKYNAETKRGAQYHQRQRDRQIHGVRY